MRVHVCTYRREELRTHPNVVLKSGGVFRLRARAATLVEDVLRARACVAASRWTSAWPGQELSLSDETDHAPERGPLGPRADNDGVRGACVRRERELQVLRYRCEHVLALRAPDARNGEPAVVPQHSFPGPGGDRKMEVCTVFHVRAMRALSGSVRLRGSVQRARHGDDSAGVRDVRVPDRVLSRGFLLHGGRPALREPALVRQHDERGDKVLQTDRAGVQAPAARVRETAGADETAPNSKGARAQRLFVGMTTKIHHYAYSQSPHCRQPATTLSCCGSLGSAITPYEQQRRIFR